MLRGTSWFCKIFIKPIMDLLFIKEARGLENRPESNFILASNHISHLDWVLSALPCLPRRFTYVGQVDNYTGLLGIARDLLYWVAGVIPINRKNEESKKEATEKAIQYLKEGYILIIYPEGTRSRTGEIQRGKLGVAKIYLRTGVPILPMGIKGTFELLPPGGKLKIKRSVRVNIGKPMVFKEEIEKVKGMDCDSAEYKEILIKITEKMMNEITRLKSELL